MKIPIITATEPAPPTIPVTVRPGTVGMEYGALGEVGRDVSGLALQISEEDRRIRDKFKAAQDEITMVKTIGDMDLYSQRVDRELDQDGEINPLYRQEMFLNSVGAKRDELLKAIPDDLLRAKVDAALDRRITIHAITQGAKGFKRNDELVEAETEAEMLRLANKGDFLGVRKFANVLVNQGLRTPQWANDKYDKYKEIGEKALITTKLESANIDVLKGLKKEIDDAEKLNQLEKSLYKAQVQKKIDSLEEKQKQEKKELAATNVYNDLKTTYGNNYEASLNALTNPEYSQLLQKKYGIDLAGITSVKAALVNEKNIEDAKVIKKQDDTAADDFVNLEKIMADPVKGLALIKQQVNNRDLHWKVGEHFKNTIINPPAMKDDPGEYFTLLQKMVQIDLSEADRYELLGEILSSQKLTIETKKSLGKDVISSKEDSHIFNDPWFKFADKSIKEELGWTEMMGFANLDNPQQAVGSYGVVIRQLIDDIKTKKYRGQEIDQRARELLLPEKIKVWRQLTGGPEPEKKVKEKYVIGNVYTNEGGEKAKYLGNGQWQKQKK